MGAILSIDFGLKRIGLAVSDQDRLFAFPHLVIQNNGLEKVLLEIVKIVDEKSIDLIVIGMPFNMDGSKGKMAKEVEEFIRGLKFKINIPVETVDERLSSFIAEENLKERGISQKGSKELIDKEAARLLLVDFLTKSKKINS